MLTVDWQGRVGDTWAAEWRRTDRSFAELAPSLDAAIGEAAPGGAFDALDIGCGAGQTSLSLADARPDATVLGIDVSAELIATAESRRAAADVANARFAVADAAHDIAASAPVDLLFSRHGVMFFDDPAAAFGCLRRAAAPGAALVFSCFRSLAENPWAGEVGSAAGGDALTQPATAATAPGPFAFADRERVCGLLGAAGWRDVVHRPVDFTYLAGAGDDPVADAVSFFSRIGPAARALQNLPAGDRPAALARIAAICTAYLRDGRVVFPAAAWLVAARNPGDAR